MKYKILELLKSQNGYISGEAISKELGISRSAVWKNINSLRKDGYKILSVVSKGYMLRFSPDRINPAKIRDVVPGNVYYYEETPSTNTEAKKAENAPDKSLFISEVQTDGRGRLGRNWASQGGCGIWMSILLYPEVPVSRISQLTLAAGIAVCRAIDGSKIKWPNDILLGGKKVSGILTEMNAEIDRTERVIVGIGVNVNTESFNDDLSKKATSLYLETGRIICRTELAEKILKEFWGIYDIFIKHGFNALKKEYIEKCATIGRDVVIIKGDNSYEAHAVDISDNGELIVEYNGTQKTLNSGEVSVRGLLGYN